jgi:hypothetical protein
VEAPDREAGTDGGRTGKRCRFCTGSVPSGVERAPRWVRKPLSMEADLGISRWAIVALVAAMIVVGTMGLVFRGTGGPDRTTDRTPASAPAQSR